MFFARCFHIHKKQKKSVYVRFFLKAQILIALLSKTNVILQLLHYTIQWINCVVHYLNVKINWKLVEKFNAELCSALKCERMWNFLTYWAGPSQYVISEMTSPLKTWHWILNAQSVIGLTVVVLNNAEKHKRLFCIKFHSMNSPHTYKVSIQKIALRVKSKAMHVNINLAWKNIFCMLGIYRIVGINFVFKSHLQLI